MSGQSGIKTLLDKAKQVIQNYQQARKLHVHNQESLKDHGQLATEEYVGSPLEIGNELLITIDIIKMATGLSKNALGRVVIIDQLSVNQENDIKASAFGIQVNVDMKVAQQMRTAYLRREQAWS